MEKIGDMKLYTMNEVLDEALGAVGTPERDAFDRDVDEAVQAYRVGEAIRQARLKKNLTQEQLGERIGVKKAQISKLESGKNISFASLMRVLKAMNIPATLNMKGVGRVALW